MRPSHASLKAMITRVSHVRNVQRQQLCKVLLTSQKKIPSRRETIIAAWAR
jgi:hypothetical protein